MDPRLIDHVRRGQAEERDAALARLLTDRKLLAEHEVDALLDAVAAGQLGDHLVREGRLTPELLAELQNALRIEQVMINLLRNTLDAMIEVPAAERRLVIESGVQPDGMVYTPYSPGPRVAAPVAVTRP